MRPRHFLLIAVALLAIVAVGATRDRAGQYDRLPEPIRAWYR